MTREQEIEIVTEVLVENMTLMAEKQRRGEAVTRDDLRGMVESFYDRVDAAEEEFASEEDPVGGLVLTFPVTNVSTNW